MAFTRIGNTREFSVLKITAHIGVLLAFIAGTAIMFSFTPTYAEDRFGDDDHGRAYNGVKSGKLKSLSHVLKTARRRVKGRVTGVTLVSRGGVSVYRVKILKKNGRLVNVFINAHYKSRSADNGDSASGLGSSGRGSRGRGSSDRDDDDDDNGHGGSGRNDDGFGDRDENSGGGGRGQDSRGRNH